MGCGNIGCFHQEISLRTDSVSVSIFILRIFWDSTSNSKKESLQSSPLKPLTTNLVVFFHMLHISIGKSSPKSFWFLGGRLPSPSAWHRCLGLFSVQCLSRDFRLPEIQVEAFCLKRATKNQKLIQIGIKYPYDPYVWYIYILTFGVY